MGGGRCLTRRLLHEACIHLDLSQLPLVARPHQSIPYEVVRKHTRAVIVIELDMVNVVVNRSEIHKVVVPEIMSVAPMASDRREYNGASENRELRLAQRHEESSEERGEVQQALDGVEGEAGPNVRVHRLMVHLVHVLVEVLVGVKEAMDTVEVNVGPKQAEDELEEKGA